MPFNAAGVFSLLFNWPSERDQGEFIDAGNMENQQKDIASAINEIVDGTRSFTGTMTIAGGVVGQPAYSFNGDTDTGIYRSSQDSIGISCGGVEVAEFYSGGINGLEIPESDFIAGTSTTEGTITAEKLRLTINNFLPAGMVMMYAASTPPSNWLECDGSEISRTDYSALFSAIGTQYGGGNDATTFNLPDFRGEFVRGWDNGRGVDAGRVFGSLQLDALQAHTHTQSLRRNSTSLTGNNKAAVVDGTGGYEEPDQVFAGVGYAAATGGGGTPRVAEETRPRNIAQMFCIKY